MEETENHGMPADFHMKECMNRNLCLQVDLVIDNCLNLLNL